MCLRELHINNARKPPALFCCIMHGVIFCRSTRSPTSPIQEEEDDEEHLSDLSDAQPRSVRPYSPAPTEVCSHHLAYTQHPCFLTCFINNIIILTDVHCCSTLLSWTLKEAVYSLLYLLWWLFSHTSFTRRSSQRLTTK